MRNAVRLPIGMTPSLTSRPPNHTMPTLDRLRTPTRTGRATAKIRVMRSPVLVMSALASRNRSCSDRDRPKARITRTPVICSRITWLIRSTLTCRDRNSGSETTSVTAMTAAMAGMVTRSSRDSAGPSWTAMTRPPRHMMTAMKSWVSADWTKSSTCSTSLVLRVIRDGMPNWFISRPEKACTRR